MSYHYYKKEYDVVVVGGGLSGVCAAIASARNNAKTAIIQSRSMYGGNSSSEIRMHVLGAGCHMSKSDVNETGILMELLLANKDRNPNQSFSVWDGILWEKVTYQENLTSYLNTNMDDVFAEEGEVKKIVCHQSTTETQYDIYGKIFIDATGHGTLGIMAGAEGRMGSEARSMYQEPNAPEEANEDTMGNTLMFHAVNMGHPVPFKKPFWAYDFSEEDLKFRHHYNCVSAFSDGGVFTEYEDGNSRNLPEFSDMDSGYWWIELGGQYDDIIADSEEIRDELMRCVYGVWNHIKNHGDHGAANYVLDWVGMVPGSRESRRLIGDYVLTENDIRENKIFDDAVAYGGWPMDNHIRGGILDFNKHPSIIYNFEGIYTIPYRCFYSKNINNLMLAGRDISVSKMAFGSTRVMATCAIGGQASGTAAALAVKKGCKPRDILNHIDELQQQLIKDDCYIPGYKNTDTGDLAKKAIITATNHMEGFEPEKVIDGYGRRINGMDHCWQSVPLEEEKAELTLTLSETTQIHRIQLTFDPNLSNEIMPSMTSGVLNRQVKGMPEELIRDYTIVIYCGDEIVKKIAIKDNIQRLNEIAMEPSCRTDRIVISVDSTYGYPSARIYEVRIY